MEREIHLGKDHGSIPGIISPTRRELNTGKNIPLVSVLLPVHNAAAYLPAAIESILNQTFSDFELIIINDGSTDDSLKIISAFSDSRIIVVNNRKNLGLIASLNNGIQLAKGKY